MLLEVVPANSVRMLRNVRGQNDDDEDTFVEELKSRYRQTHCYNLDDFCNVQSTNQFFKAKVSLGDNLTDKKIAVNKAYNEDESENKELSLDGVCNKSYTENTSTFKHRITMSSMKKVINIQLLDIIRLLENQ